MSIHVATTLVALSLLPATLALADQDRLVLDYQFDIDDISEIEIDGSVGQMIFETGNPDEIRLVLEIEGDDGGWFHRAKDVSDVELRSRIAGDRLILTQDEKKTNTVWRILMPEVTRTRVHLGVGEIRGEFGNTDLDIDMGVGEVDIQLPLDSAGDIDLSVGVGDISLQGGIDVDADRAMVSQDLRARGNGNRDLRVDLGVGDIDVVLE